MLCTFVVILLSYRVKSELTDSEAASFIQSLRSKRFMGGTKEEMIELKEEQDEYKTEMVEEKREKTEPSFWGRK
ncbi:hypothetical protein SNEBB_006721 [Seison nebaliae]|nr:hypothetical protein SNEBB_006721 [Seison nebaliae]